eukprot:m.12337 g.12337  ORF g.12337 m.12337 type:complete len:282 (-) comp2721_c0_seq1:1572-2417(-)
MDYSDQQEHDRQYSPSRWAPRPDVIAAHCGFLATESARVRAAHGSTLLAYGTGDDEKIELVRPHTDDRNVIAVYFHGGMWQALGMTDSLFAAEPLLASGTSLAAVEYTLAPKASMSVIVDQCVHATQHLHSQFPAAKLYLFGHSAGGHLALCVLQALAGTSAGAAIIGACSVSGLFDLAPVKRCYANEALQLTDAEVDALSPLRHAAAVASAHVPIILAMSEHDPTAFREHTLQMKSALDAQSAGVLFFDYPGLDHFNVNEKLSDPAYDLTQHILAALKST